MSSPNTALSQSLLRGAFAAARPLPPHHLLRPRPNLIRNYAAAATTPAPHQPASVSPPARPSRLTHAAPFSAFLTDSFARQHTYLRISLTERCNLRCTYCMPADGVPLSPAATQLTTPEVLMLAGLFVGQGVNKIRLTGGEPTVRKDILELMEGLGRLRRGQEEGKGLKEICVTSNGLVLKNKLERMVQAGLTGVNISLDTLEPGMFEIMTRRKGWERVWACVERILEMNRLGAGVRLKINVVVMRGVNESEVLKFVELGRERDLEVRFIEYMPFDGNRWRKEKMVSYEELLQRIREKYPGLKKVVDGKTETSKTWQVEGFKGRVGFVTSMTENFCGGCNRLRITSDGNLKVCLFGNAEVSLRDLLRKETGGRPIDKEAYEAMKQVQMGRRAGEVDGWLGSDERERELLEVIGAAVGRKKERHAGMGNLENMKNRPMILIDEPQQTNRQNLVALSTSSPQAFSLLKTISSSSNPLSKIYHAPYQSFHSGSRLFSTSTLRPSKSQNVDSFPHLTSNSEIHVVPISSKTPTHRIAAATASVTFSNGSPLPLIRSNALKKGDVLAVARIAGVMAAKRTSDIVPLCHNGVGLEGVKVKVEPVDGTREVTAHQTSSSEYEKTAVTDFLQKRLGLYGGIRIVAEVECFGKTGVEMEALCAVVGAGLSVLDMVKGVDKGCVMEGVEVVRKEGGKSGVWKKDRW